jgi:endonuclease/exonuclease/phosphatase family metal-dependent hydrolase
MRVLTWNVWFGEYQQEQRTIALVSELARRKPEVIALQEITEPVREALDDLAGYELFDDEGGDGLGYGVVVMTRVAVARAAVLGGMPTQMGRRLVAVELANGLTVATIHLESTSFGGKDRVAQLRALQPWLRARSADFVLVGDMNFTPEDAAETAALEPGLVDVWPALHAEPGYTVDTDVNTMRLESSGAPVQKRIDRAFLHSARWRATAIERVGMAPIDDFGTFTSDHFGLQVTLGTP